MALYIAIQNETAGSTALWVAMVLGFLIGLIWQIKYNRQAKNSAPRDPNLHG
jgi:hypothetical protein